jgi:hypothetical protein
MSQPDDDRSERRAGAENAAEERSMTIEEFCQSERISRALFYIMRREGWGPRLMYVGASVRISPEARRDWRREREVAAAAGIRRGKIPAKPGVGCPGDLQDKKNDPAESE